MFIQVIYFDSITKYFKRISLIKKIIIFEYCIYEKNSLILLDKIIK